MEDFAQIARPTPEGVEGSLGLLRRRPVPFAEAELTSRLDLLFLPFLKGIPTAAQRVARLQTALRLAASHLSPEREIVYRHVFLEPGDPEVEKRLRQACDEINEGRSGEAQVETSAARRIGDRMLPVLAKLLLDPDFENELDEQHPLARAATARLLSDPVDAFELVTYKCEVSVDDTDLRKQEEHRTLRMRLLLPHQRVIGFRYYNRCSPPTPVKDGVTMLSEGHTYLGTLPETLTGSPADYWWMHFIHLGERKEPGDEVEIEMRERYFDKDMRDNHPHLTVLVRFESLQTVNLAVRLPTQRRDDATPVARVVKDPYDANILVDTWEIEPSDDGWVRQEFVDCKVGLQYGIFFDDFDLYN